MKAGGSFKTWFDSLPAILGADVRRVVEAIVAAKRRDAGIVWGIGAHVIKTGVSPVLIDLMERGYVSALAMNGAGIIHDFEIALSGATSEDVDEALGPGRFGMAEETGTQLNEAIAAARAAGKGLGQGVAEFLARRNPPHAARSLAIAAHRLGIPITVHVALGTDITTAHDDVERIAEGPFGSRQTQVEARHEAPARPFIGNRLEHRVVREQRVPREVHLRHEPRSKRRAEHGKVDVRRAPGVVVIPPRVGAGLDGDEFVPTVRVRHGAARAGEIGIEGRRVLVLRVAIAAGGVGLPHFKQGAGHRTGIFVKQPAGDDDSLSLGFVGVLPGQITVGVADRPPAVHGRLEIRERLGQADERPGRRAVPRGQVRWIEQRRLTAGHIGFNHVRES